MGPEGDQLASRKPAPVSQIAEQLQRQPFALVGFSSNAMNEQPGKSRVKALADRFPAEQEAGDPGPARDVPLEQAKPGLIVVDRAFHIAPLERQFAQLAADAGLIQPAFGQDRGRLELFSRRVVAAAQHQHVPQPLGDLEAGQLVDGAAFGDPVLLLGDLQRCCARAWTAARIANGSAAWLSLAASK